jgi:hypothetical protein
MKPQIFLKKTPSNIKSNAFNIRATPLWFASMDIQFILDLYATSSYCTSYMTKIDKSITFELHSIIEKCILDKTDANIKI